MDIFIVSDFNENYVWIFILLKLFWNFDFILMLNVMHFAEKQLNETDANLYASSFHLQSKAVRVTEVTLGGAQ